MLIPIGFFGAGGAAGAYELISTAYGTGSSGTITFSSLPAGYKHLQLRAVVRNTDTTYAADFLKLRFNSDSGANYSQHQLNGNGSTVASVGYSGTTEIFAGNITTNGFTANAFGAIICDLLDPFSTIKNKTTRSLNGFVGTTNRIYMDSGSWRNTAAVTSIELTTSSGKFFTTTSRFSLYGIKE